MQFPTEKDFRFTRTFIAARDLSQSLDKFMERAALDRYQAVQLVLHELAVQIMGEVGMRQISRDLQYRIKGFRQDLDAALAQQETRRRRHIAKPAVEAPEPEKAGV